jgi:hypothetical protein
VGFRHLLLLMPMSWVARSWRPSSSSAVDAEEMGGGSHRIGNEIDEGPCMGSTSSSVVNPDKLNGGSRRIGKSNILL